MSPQGLWQGQWQLGWPPRQPTPWPTPVVQAVLLALPDVWHDPHGMQEMQDMHDVRGMHGAAARQHWQAALGLAPCAPVLRNGVRVGWRSACGQDLRVSYGRWPQDKPARSGVAASVVLVAWASAPAAASAMQWAVDCTPDLALPEGAALLHLYGAEPSADFPRAWAELEASAKLEGGLREHLRPPRPQQLQSRRAGAWVVALAANVSAG